jgi:hypothetical protein
MALRASRQTRGTVEAARALAAFALALGCASTQVETAQRIPESERLPRPPMVVVYDFAVSPEDFVADTLGSEFASASESAPEPSDAGHRAARALSQAIVDALKQRGIEATGGTRASPPPIDALVLKGQFLKIEKGSRVKRMTIGFGAGTPELRVQGQVYQVTTSGLRRLADGEVAVVGAKTPGMAVPMAGAAALGTVATAAVISGGINLAREVKGAVDDETSQIAKEIAELAEQYYKRQGWL